MSTHNMDERRLAPAVLMGPVSRTTMAAVQHNTDIARAALEASGSSPGLASFEEAPAAPALAAAQEYYLQAMLAAREGDMTTAHAAGTAAGVAEAVSDVLGESGVLARDRAMVGTVPSTYWATQVQNAGYAHASRWPAVPLTTELVALLAGSHATNLRVGQDAPRPAVAPGAPQSQQYIASNAVLHANPR